MEDEDLFDFDADLFEEEVFVEGKSVEINRRHSLTFDYFQMKRKLQL